MHKNLEAGSVTLFDRSPHALAAKRSSFSTERCCETTVRRLYNTLVITIGGMVSQMRPPATRVAGYFHPKAIIGIGR